MILEGNVYQNKKTKDFYFVTDIRRDATNEREDDWLVNYEKLGNNAEKFSREINEFLEKFVMVQFTSENTEVEVVENARYQ